MSKLRFPLTVCGLIENEEAEALFALAAGKRVIEFGAYHGYSALCMAQSAELVVTVDSHAKEPPYGAKWKADAHRDNVGTMWENILRHDMMHKIVPVLGPGHWAAQKVLRPGEFEFGFVDAMHTYEAVVLDIAAMETLLKPGSKIAFHDYNERFPGVVKAVEGWRAGRPIEVIKSLAVVTL